MVFAGLLLAGLVALRMAYLPPAWFLHAYARWHPGVLFDVTTREPLLALTIDDAPHPDVTPALLDLLHQHNVRATFFCLGENAARYPDLLRQIRDRGHEIANHMYSDQRSVGLPSPEFVDEMQRTQRLLDTVGGSRWLRPGSGILDRRTTQLIVDNGFVPTLGSAYPLDLRLPAPLASQQFLRAARPGAILVLHDGAGRTRTLRILEHALPQLLDKGYRFVSLSDLVASGTDERRE